jgi:hypothetical protein
MIFWYNWEEQIRAIGTLARVRSRRRGEGRSRLPAIVHKGAAWLCAARLCNREECSSAGAPPGTRRSRSGGPSARQQQGSREEPRRRGVPEDGARSRPWATAPSTIPIPFAHKGPRSTVPPPLNPPPRKPSDKECSQCAALPPAPSY